MYEGGIEQNFVVAVVRDINKILLAEDVEKLPGVVERDVLTVRVELIGEPRRGWLQKTAVRP